jgi:hypothetical protein
VRGRQPRNAAADDGQFHRDTCVTRSSSMAMNAG